MTPTGTAAGPLAGCRVLDLAQPMGLHCAKLLADMGADIVKVEPPGGDPARRMPPFKGGVPHPEGSLYWLHYNSNKRSVTLNLETVDGRAILRQLAATADVVLETHPPGWMAGRGLGYHDLSAINPGLVMCAITPFGQTGPYSAYKGTDIVGLAMSNTMVLSGEPGKPPLQAPGELAYGMASAYAAYGIALALYQRSSTGLGQYIDASMHECAVHLAGYAIPNYSVHSTKPFRTPRSQAGGDIYQLYLAKDGGYVMLFILPSEQWRRLVEWMGSPAEVNDPLFDRVEFRRQNSDLIRGVVAEFCARYTKDELYEEGQRRRIGISALYTPAEFVESAQVQARAVFTPVDHPVVGSYPTMGSGVGLSAMTNPPHRRAPLLGEHNAAVFGDELGCSPDDLRALAAAGVI